MKYVSKHYVRFPGRTVTPGEIFDGKLLDKEQLNRLIRLEAIQELKPLALDDDPDQEPDQEPDQKPDQKPDQEEPKQDGGEEQQVDEEEDDDQEDDEERNIDASEGLVSQAEPEPVKAAKPATKTTGRKAK